MAHTLTGWHRIRSGATQGSWIAAAARVAVLAVIVVGALLRSTDPVALLMDTSFVALAAMGVGLVLGLAGQPTLCQAAFMLVGAYTYTLLARSAGPGLPTTLAGVAAVAAGLVLAGAVSPVLRARGYVLALATITLDLLVRQVFRTGTWVPGREGGLADVPPISALGVDLVEPAHYLALAGAAVLVVGGAIHLRYGRGRRRRSLQVLASDQDLLAEFGRAPGRVKRELFVLGGGLGALAGAVTVASFGFVQPTSFGIEDSFALAVAVVIGGRDRIAGAVVGAVVYELAAPLLGPELASLQPVVLGLTVIACMHLFPGGLLPRLPVSRVRPTHRPHRLPARAGAPEPVDGAQLSVRSLTCEFGAVRAVDRVDLDLGPGSLTALVGPNGAGKSTLLGAVAGEIRSGGTIELDGRRMPSTAAARARAGITRSHQRVRLVETMTALDSVMVGVDLEGDRHGGYREAERRARAEACLAEVGLRDLADSRVAELTFAQRRFVDLARLVAARPRLALLDEPSAGLDAREREVVIGLVSELNDAGCTVVVVEHDLQFVRDVAREVVALVEGRVLAAGPVGEVLSMPAFEDAYLGGAVA